MPEHKYISERFERRTYIKGVFSGKFTGQLDLLKSDERYERFFDLEILEGELFTTQDKITRWDEGNEPPEFSTSSHFSIRGPGEIHLAIRQYDESLKHYKVRLKALKLINCRLTRQMYQGKEVLGTIEGEVCGYMLHHEAIIEEVKESQPDKKSYTGISRIQEQRDTTLPPKERLLPLFTPIREHFSSTSQPHQRPGCFSLSGFLSALLFLFSVITFPMYWIPGLIFLVLSLWLVPRFFNWLTRLLGLRLPRWGEVILRLGLALILLTCLVQLYKLFREQSLSDARFFLGSDAQLQKINKQNKDSFDYHYNTGIELCKLKKYEQALSHIERATTFASGKNKQLADTEKAALLNIQAEKLVKQEFYAESIPVYTELITLTHSNPVYLYKRAESFIALSKIKEAVADLKQGIALGDRPSVILHDKINPLKTRVKEIVILCKDGTYSRSKHRQGTCSHHGGVQNWEHKIMEEYREY